MPKEIIGIAADYGATTRSPCLAAFFRIHGNAENATSTPTTESGSGPAAAGSRYIATDRPAVPSVSSQTKGLLVNDDGSVDVYFGPKAPPGKENNWIQTVPGQGLEYAPPALRPAGAAVQPDLARRELQPSSATPYLIARLRTSCQTNQHVLRRYSADHFVITLTSPSVHRGYS